MNYFLTDHLGSLRVIVDGTGKVLERNDYYPFEGETGEVTTRNWRLIDSSIMGRRSR